jgi:tRNA(His) 5'-end guanylyltransferase
LKRIVERQSDENLGLKNVLLRAIDGKLAAFDARVFSIPDPFEVHNYFVWRQQDATRNSISMGAQALYSHKELHGKSTSDMQDMMHDKGVNWNDYPARFKRGGFVLKQTVIEEVPGVPVNATRHKWGTIDPPVFTKEPIFTQMRIPVITGSENMVSLSDLANVPAF